MEDLNLGMFKSYDIRTKNHNLTDELRIRLCNAVALYYRDVLKVKSVVICRDARLYVPQIAQDMTAVMRKAGIGVYLNPLPISTCQFYFTCMQYKESAGLMLTASHNPGEYVGIKLVSKGLFPIAMDYGPEGGIRKIMQYYKDNCRVESDKMIAKCIVINELENYVNYSMRLAGVKEGSLKGLKVMLEFLNGSAGVEQALAFQKAGADVEVRDVVPNGFFPGGDPNPIIESSVAPAREAMKKGNFDIGFCFDGDGDRMDFMDSDGQQIVPGLNMSIIIENLLPIYDGKKRDFYADVKAIPVSLCEIAKHDVNVHIIRNGHSFIKAKLRDNCDKGFFASEEESAHYYINLPYDDKHPEKGYAAVESTLFFSLVTARSYMANPQAYKRARQIQNSIFRVREWPILCEAAPEKMPEILAKVEKRMRELGAIVIDRMEDGSDLDATLMRFNLPEKFTKDTNLEGKVWGQVAQRISRSEDAMARWEVVSNSKEECERLNNEVRKIVSEYVDAGFARFGNED